MAAWSLADWSFEPGVIVGLAALIGAYIAGVRRLRPETLWGEYVVSTGEIVSFAGGILLIAVVLVSPLDTLSDQMFSAHMVQHIALLYLAPPLLLLGVPGWIFGPLVARPVVAKVLKWLTHPLTALVVFNGSLVMWHMTFFWDMALVDRPVHALEHGMFLVSGLVAWWPVFGPTGAPGRLSYPAQCLYLFVQSLVPAIIGAFVAFSTIVVYPVYGETPKLWGLSPLADQQIAGVLMKILGSVFLWVLVSVRFFQWFNQEEHENEKLLDDGVHHSP